MGIATAPIQQVTTAVSSCRLVVRDQPTLSEISQFVIAGVQIGQPVVAVAGPTCLKEIARSLTEAGLKTEALLRTGRLVFLTAPDCMSQLTNPVDPLQRGPLRRGGPLLRWVSDWSWAYSNGTISADVLRYQRRVHEFVRSVSALSICTVHCQQLQRSSLLALLADHRRAARA